MEHPGDAPADRIRIRRVHEPPSPDDGLRVLVDRLWPRGLGKEDARLDEWPEAVAPSAGLRRWFHGPDGDYPEVGRRYEGELDTGEAAEALSRLRDLADSDGPPTLLTAAEEPGRGHAAVPARRLAAR